MSITLPTSPLPSTATQKLIDYGGWQAPEFGGPATRVDRMGNRFSQTFTTPRLKPEVARLWIARLVRGVGQTVRCPFYQEGFDPGSAGSVRVNGGGQAGTSLAVDGVTAGYTFVEGQFITVVHGGRYYLHMVAADVTASGGGEATLTIEPMLRVSPSNNAVVKVEDTAIEGILSGIENGWTMERARYQGLTFTITEAE